MTRLGILAGVLGLWGCANPAPPPQAAATSAAPAAASAYFDNAGRDDVLSGGARRITISTPKGPHWVWTKQRRDGQGSLPLGRAAIR
jgi:proline iminopeptidase